MEKKPKKCKIKGCSNLGAYKGLSSTGKKKYRTICILHRNRKPQRAKILREKQNRYRENNPYKVEARKMYNIALLRGDLVKPSKCSVCGKKATIQGHHPDYAKPLEVIWVCPKCHTKIHFPHLAQSPRDN